MALPSRERVVELVTPVVESAGYDLEDVTVAAAGKHSSITIVVDRDAGAGLDDAADLSRAVESVLDAYDTSSTPYTLEVTSPGVDRPLTAPRHWRRNRGRVVALDLADGASLRGRIGPSDDTAVRIVVNDKGRLGVREVPLADITRAVVQIEFSRPSAAELELSGEVPAGRAHAGEDLVDTAGDAGDDHPGTDGETVDGETVDGETVDGETVDDEKKVDK